MKNLNLLRARASRTVLILLSGSLLFLIGYSYGSQAPASGSINAATAKGYFQSYYQSARPLNAAVKGFAIDISQYQAMGQIAQQYPDIKGFRVYFGKDENGGRLGLVIGINQNGQEEGRMILSTFGGMLESCPVACDEASPISGQ
ncbi:MAG TPA: hypothetical protein P5550_11685 [Bacteroidales bacterium]|nr:hypothetical protein [Bacteroidales bacterium]